MGLSQLPVAVVTGASKGIGRAIATALCKSSCRVVLNYNSSSLHDVEALCSSMESLTGMKDICVPVKANCANLSEVTAMFHKIKTDVGPIDILVNNAGVTRDGLLLKMKHEDFFDIMNINLGSVFYCTQAAISTSMLKRKKGRIINVGSVVGQLGNVGQSNYAASKAGIIGFTKSCAKEFASRGITVNAVSPGFIETHMTTQVSTESIISTIPLKRFGTTDEVAGLVRYLALDPSAAYITGHCLNIDGGLGIGAT